MRACPTTRHLEGIVLACFLEVLLLCFGLEHYIYEQFGSDDYALQGHVWDYGSSCKKIELNTKGWLGDKSPYPHGRASFNMELTSETRRNQDFASSIERLPMDVCHIRFWCLASGWLFSLQRLPKEVDNPPPGLCQAVLIHLNSSV